MSDSGRSRLKCSCGPPKNVNFIISNIQIMLYTKNLSCDKHILHDIKYLN
jgi:hypothetical protein